MDDVKLVGTGKYLAYEGYLACMDERETKWRLSAISLDRKSYGEMHFTYVGTFQSQTDIEIYIAMH